MLLKFEFIPAKRRVAGLNTITHYLEEGLWPEDLC